MLRENVLESLLAPYTDNNVIGVIVTNTPHITIHVIQELAAGKHGKPYKLDISIYKDKFKGRAMIYNGFTGDIMWLVQNK